MNHTEVEHMQAQPRWPWFAAGVLLFASAALGAGSVHRLWLPCRGSMLDGTVFGPKETPDIAEACLRRMDEGFPFLYFAEDVGMAPSASELGGLAMMLATASWIVLVLGLRLSRGNTIIALIAAVAPSVLAVLSWSAAVNPSSGLDDYVTGWLWISVDAVAVVVFVVLCVRNSDIERSILPGLAFVLWGATVFGVGHLFMDVSAMVGFNEYNWDTPPGTGWISVAVLVIAGSAAFGYGRRRHVSPTMAPSVSLPA